jgi:hypothetical protein
MLSLISGGTYRAPGGSVSELFFPGCDAALGRENGRLSRQLGGTFTGGPIDPQTAARRFPRQ